MAELYRGDGRRQRVASTVCGNRHAERSARVGVGSSMRRLAVCALLILATIPHSVPDARAQSADLAVPGASRRSEGDPRWAFQPMGPNGARITRIDSLDRGGWVSLSSDGRLFVWRDQLAVGGGAVWEELLLPGETVRRMLLFAVIDEGSAVVGIDAGGGIWSWALTPNPEAARLGRIPEAIAARAVALLPEISERRSGNPPALLVASRDGAFARVTSSGVESWTARFESEARDGAREAEGGGEHDGARLRPSLRCVQRAPGGPGLLLALSDWEGLFASVDGGRTFAPVTGELPKHVVAIDAGAGDAFYAMTSEGLYRSRDRGRLWDLCSERLTPAADRDAIVALVAGDGGDLWVLTSEGELHHNSAQHDTWERVLANVPAEMLWVADEGDAHAIATSRGVLVARGPQGEWQWANAGLDHATVLSATAVGEGGRIWWLDTDLGAFISRDAGSSWEPIDGSRIEPGAAAEELACVEEGETLEPPPGREAIACAGDEGDYWLGTDAGLFRGTTLGDWAFAGLEDERVIEIVVGPQETPWIFARTPQALLASDSRGAAWEEVRLPAGLRVTAIGLAATSQQLLLGTFRHGLFVAELPASRPADAAALPIQALPNPFGEIVALRCALTARQWSAATMATGSARMAGVTAAGQGGNATELRIYSVHGQLVRRMVAPEQVTGPEGEIALQWEWDGLDDRGLPVPSGVYLVSMNAGAQRFMGKLIKLR
jgi:hypothetical protein